MGKAAKYAGLAGAAQGFTQAVGLNWQNYQREMDVEREKRLAQYRDELAGARDDKRFDQQQALLDTRLEADRKLWEQRDEARLKELDLRLGAAADASAAQRSADMQTVVATRIDEVMSDPNELAAADAWAAKQVDQISSWYTPESVEFKEFGGSRDSAMNHFRTLYMNDRAEQISRIYGQRLGGSTDAGAPIKTEDSLTPPDEAVQMLLRDPSPAAIAEFKEVFGNTAFEQIADRIPAPTGTTQGSTPSAGVMSRPVRSGMIPEVVSGAKAAGRAAGAVWDSFKIPQ